MKQLSFPCSQGLASLQTAAHGDAVYNGSVSVTIHLPHTSLYSGVGPFPSASEESFASSLSLPSDFLQSGILLLSQIHFP